MLKDIMKISKLCFLIVPLLLVGCSRNSPGTNTNTTIKEDCFIKEDTSIDFLCMADSDYHDELQGMVDDFQKSEPHVKVRLYNPLGSGKYDTIEKIIVSGFFKEDYPDIAQCYPDNVVKYLAQGYAVNLDEYLNNEEYGILGEDREDYISAFLLEGTKYVKEGTYSLPFCKSTELLYYNADVLLGLDLSAVDVSINNGNPLDSTYLEDLTWEELFEKLCPALDSYNNLCDEEHKIFIKDNKSAIVTYDSDENFFITLAEQYGYGYTSVDEEGKGHVEYENNDMKALLKNMNQYKANGYLKTRGSNNNEYVSGLFTARKSLFTISSTAGLVYNFNKNNPFTIGASKIPYPEGKEYSSINQGPSLCVLDHKDKNRSLAAYLLWKHMTNKDNASSWSLATGYMGIRNSSYESDEYTKAITIQEGDDKFKISTANNLLKIRDVRDGTFNTLIFRGSGNVRTNVGKLMRDVLLSDGSDEKINELFSSYVEDTNKYLK